MNKYTSKQIAESDDLFEKQIHKVRKFYLSRNPDKMVQSILKPDIAFTAILIIGFQRITKNKKDMKS